jgi:hypothetical protein
MRLVVTGGDVDEVMDIHHSLSRLNEIDIDKKISFSDEELDYFFSKLTNHVIIVKPITKILPDEELRYKNDYPTLLLFFSCRQQLLTLFITCQHTHNWIDMAYMKINLYRIKKKHLLAFTTSKYSTNPNITFE